MKFYFKKITIFDVENYFEIAANKKKDTRSMQNTKPYLVRNNLESTYRVFKKLSYKYKFPIWLNAHSLSILRRSLASKYSNVYYIYVRDGSRIKDFLGICFFTPSKDLMLCLKPGKVSGRAMFSDTLFAPELISFLSSR
jgi:hypothetical protein